MNCVFVPVFRTSTPSVIVQRWSTLVRLITMQASTSETACLTVVISTKHMTRAVRGLCQDTMISWSCICEGFAAHASRCCSVSRQQ